ncbi:metallophosphoesterase family protein [Archangium sp.]|uniref:metallophosphoesterase family protein n=1 Tax=Archangium sp. TaxID=1872627 RepID=UPI00389A0198
MASETHVLTTPGAGTAPVQRPPKRKMVTWFDPLVLLKAGVRSLISTTIGEQADRRLLDALAAPKGAPTDLSVDDAGRPREELWFDFVADLGDGWDSTYEVAVEVCKPTLSLRDETGTAYETRSGELLIFGGDEVYPEGDVKEYQERTVRPWEAARPKTQQAPRLFAIPGNHDWYDGLVSFMRLFCQGRGPAGWKTEQRRSYFAVKLPRGWWLLGVDMQLDSDLDEPQVQYFQELAKTQIGPDDRIILCLAEPAWLLAHVRPPGDRTYLDNNLDFLEQNVLGKKVSVFLTGDLHQYRRHSNDEGRQKIIAGGGGAFLHPTHVPRKDVVLPEGFTARKAFPPPEESRRLCWRNLGFLGHNPTMGLFTGILYLLLAWMQVGDLREGGTVTWKLSRVLGAALINPGVVLLSALLVLGLVVFADTRFGWGRAVAGVLHGVAHLAAALWMFWAAFALTGSFLRLGSVPQELLGAVLVFAGGFLLGPTILGVYLLISANGFGAHANEAFSALAIPDWKNFLRLRIDKEGQLWIFPVGIRRVPREWKPGQTVREPEWVADDKDATPPELIEPPIVIGSARAASTSPRVAGAGRPEYAGLAPSTLV